MIAKREDWARLMGAAIEDCGSRPYHGPMPCIRFVSDVVQAFTGTDLCGDFRTAFQTEAEAVASLGAGGLFEVVDRVCRAAGMESVTPAEARKGDVVLFSRRGIEWVALCVGVVSVMVAPAGVAYVVTANAKAAWRIS